MTNSEYMLAANAITEAICDRTCHADSCNGLCALKLLSIGLDSYKDGSCIKDAIEIVMNANSMAIHRSNMKYDRVYGGDRIQKGERSARHEILRSTG